MQADANLQHHTAANRRFFGIAIFKFLVGIAVALHKQIGILSCRNGRSIDGALSRVAGLAAGEMSASQLGGAA